MKLQNFPFVDVEVVTDFLSQPTKLVFELATEDNRKVYMSSILPMSDDSAVVMVDKDKFIGFWQNSGQCLELSRGDIQAWQADYKYRWAERGFSLGKENPVPLAIVSVGKKRTFNNYLKDKYYCSFINGITRSLWLLVNDVKRFPVYVHDVDEARLLAWHAGVSYKSFYIGKFFRESLAVHCR